MREQLFLEIKTLALSFESGLEAIGDVNDEMLSEENRRGLRVRFVNRVRCNGLGFLFGE